MYPYQSNYDSSKANSRIVMSYLRDVRGRAIEDHTDDPKAQGEGWDFTIDGVTTEFKTCNRIHQTHNVAFEIVSNSRKASPGCMLTSKARILCYYDTVDLIVHFFDLPKLKVTIESSPQSRWDAYKITTSIPGGSGFAYATFGLLLPLSLIDSEKLWHPTFDIAKYVKGLA